MKKPCESTKNVQELLEILPNGPEKQSVMDALNRTFRHEARAHEIVDAILIAFGERGRAPLPDTAVVEVEFDDLGNPTNGDTALASCIRYYINGASHYYADCIKQKYRVTFERITEGEDVRC